MAPVAGLNHVQPGRWWSKDTVAVVTGSNKGLGQAIVLHLARHGVTVVSTARDSQLGAAAVESAVKVEPQLAEFIHFHQLDITNEQSVVELAAWLESTFGGIDILINNAGISKNKLDVYEDAVETVGTNYFGTRRVTENLLPLMRASPQGARIVMISSQASLLEHFANNEFVRMTVQEAVEHLDKGMVDALAAKYLEDMKGGRAVEEKWTFPHHYKEAKLCLNTYTRILAGELAERGEEHRVSVNALCPGLFASDMSTAAFARCNSEYMERLVAQYGMVSVTEAATAPVWLALLPRGDYPHGLFFIKRSPHSAF